jgi:chorismate-pyruvate lyase
MTDNGLPARRGTMTASGDLDEVDAVMLRGLHPAARALVTTSDPTTPTLERLVGEPIAVEVVVQDETRLPAPLFELEAVDQNEPVLLQRARLRGARTGRVWLRVASVLLSGRVDHAVVTQLRPPTEPRTPVEVLAELYPEAVQRRQLLRWRPRIAGADDEIFGLEVKAGLVTRTYRVLLGTRPVALIEEAFPAHHWPDRPNVAAPTGSAAQ